MGCWNGTCGVSRLPILAGEPIRLFLMLGRPHMVAERNLVGSPEAWRATREPEYVDAAGQRYDYPSQDGATRTLDVEAHERNQQHRKWRDGWFAGLCYSTDVFYPRCLPLIGKYDDYGGIEEIQNILNAGIIRSQFQLDLDEYPAGEFDIPVAITRDMSLEDLLHAIERGGVTVTVNGEHLPVASWMVREDIFQAILSTKLEGLWRTQSIGVSDYYASAEEYRQLLVADTAKADEFRTVDPPVSPKLLELSNEFQAVKRLGSENLCLRYLMYPLQDRGLMYYDRWLTAAFQNKQIAPESESTKSLFRELADHAFFAYALEAARIAWMPQAGRGSQSACTSVPNAIARQVLATTTTWQQEWAADEAAPEAAPVVPRKSKKPVKKAVKKSKR